MNESEKSMMFGFLVLLLMNDLQEIDGSIVIGIVVIAGNLLGLFLFVAAAVFMFKGR